MNLNFFLLGGLLLCLFLIGLGWGYSGILDTMIYQIVWNADDVLDAEGVIGIFMLSSMIGIQILQKYSETFLRFINPLSPVSYHFL